MAAATTPATRPHWKDRGIAMAGAISDAYDVLMAFLGHLSRFVLLVCLGISMAQVILHLPDEIIGVVIIIQVLTLDIGGLSLISLAKHAEEIGNVKAAQTGHRTAWALIAITMATLVCAAVGHMYPNTKTNMDNVENVLVLIRMAMTIAYGHVVHSMRHALQTHAQKQIDQAAEVARLQQETSDLQAKLQTATTAAKNQQEQASLQAATLQSQLQEAQKNGSSLHLSLQEKELSLKAQMKAQQEKMEAEMKAQKLSLQARIDAEVKAAVKAQQQQMEAEVEALKQSNAHLKAKLKAQTEADVKPAPKASNEKFDARQFVFSCLRENSDLKISEIATLARKQGQELSEPTISRYRKEYRESSNESSAM